MTDAPSMNDIASDPRNAEPTLVDIARWSEAIECDPWDLLSQILDAGSAG